MLVCKTEGESEGKIKCPENEMKRRDIMKDRRQLGRMAKQACMVKVAVFFGFSIYLTHHRNSYLSSHLFWKILSFFFVLTLSPSFSFPRLVNNTSLHIHK